MDICKFNEILIKYNLMNKVWIYSSRLISSKINNDNKDEYLKLFSILFSLIDDGNICMSLNKDILKNKWNNKIEGIKTQYESSLNELDILKEESNNSIDFYLESIKDLNELIGKDKLFIIDKDYLYIKKYFNSKESIKENIDKLFNINFKSSNVIDYKDIRKDSNFELSEGQEKAVIEGINKNLIITGGPGTGKTTSILFLLINILKNNENIKVNLIAPSGKASSRMKESIINGINNSLSEEFKNNNIELINKIKSLEESTIHRLLGVNLKDKGFIYNKNNKFDSNNVFVIDEASMIDINLFSSLIESISINSRIFIMGDENQLPSVDVGSVFEGLLHKNSLKNNIIKLDESKRFKKGSPIYELASNINNGNDLNLKEDDFKDPKEFKIIPNEKSKYPIYYYSDSNDNDKEIINNIISKWNDYFYKNLKSMSKDLDFNDYESLKKLFSYSEASKILCAGNIGSRGVLNINLLIRRLNNLNKNLNSYSEGEIVMINKNNKSLDLYNGDSGLIVSFKNDDNLYFMVKKTSKITSKNEYYKNKIFKNNDFIFYPLSLLSSNEIDLAYSITIHKSQGSDYPSILVILPKNENHPLINRQIVYTAITRTKGSTYIYSSLKVLNKSKDTVLKRDTNID